MRPWLTPIKLAALCVVSMASGATIYHVSRLPADLVQIDAINALTFQLVHCQGTLFGWDEPEQEQTLDVPGPQDIIRL